MACVIIGGGIIGLCAAWAARKRGYDVELYEQGPLPQPMSASVQHNPVLLERYGASYAAQSFSCLGEQARQQLWHDSEWRQTQSVGALVVTKQSPADITQMHNTVLAPSHLSAAAMEQSGCAVTWHPHKHLSEAYPAFHWRKSAGAYEFGNASFLNSQAFIDHLYAHILRMGVRVYPHTPVHHLHPDTQQVHFGDGWYETPDICIVAAGPWLPDLLPGQIFQKIDKKLSIFECQTLVLEPPLEEIYNWQTSPILIDGDSAGSQFMYVPPMGGHGLQIHPLLYPPFTNTIPANTPDSNAMEKAVSERIKDSQRYQLSAKHASYEIFSQAHQPEILPLHPEHPFFAITGTSGHGFMLAPLLAEITLDMISKTQTQRLTTYHQYHAALL